MKPNPSLDKLVEEMEEFYNVSSSAPTATDNIVSGECYAIKSPESWDRGVVHEIVDNDVTVMFMDYGNIDVVTPEQVYPLSSRFNVPVQSYPCRLLGVEPINAEEGWTDDAIDLMNELTQDKCLLMQTIHFPDDAETERYGVRLFDMGIPLSRMLADANHAQLVDIPDEPGRFPSTTSSLNDSIGQYVESIVTSATAIAIQREMESKMSTSDVIVDDESVLEVGYLHGEGPEHFYVQLHNGGGAGDRTKLQELEESIKQHFIDGCGEEEVAIESLKTGDSVLVNTDDGYYRATIASMQEGSVEVNSHLISLTSKLYIET